MNQEMILLVSSALAIGAVHTLLGPDHYLPFIVLAKARKWSALRATIITTFCGIGHVLSGMLFGLVAISIGIGLGKLQFIENYRNSIAAWILIGFGFAYALWGVRRIYKNRPHTHAHLHSDGSRHLHQHRHHDEHAHPHMQPANSELTPWILFIIFILGPCEPLIPLIMYPAVKGSIINTFLVTLFFGLATLLVMLGMLFIALYGVKKVQFPFIARYGNVIAGTIICGCGLGIKFFGL